MVELDGRRYHTASDQFERDRERTVVFERAGLRVLRLTWRMVHLDGEETLRKTRRFGAHAAGKG